jgi:hypothetical protein
MLIKVKVFPGSSKPGVIRKSPDNLTVKTKAKAEVGKANAEALGLIAGYLNAPISSLRIIKGLRSKNKIIEIKGR